MFEALEIVLVASIMLFALFFGLLPAVQVTKFKFPSPFLILACLFVMWLALVLYQSFLIERVFTILTDEYSSRHLTAVSPGEIKRGQKVVGEFIASQNHLGIIGFRFWTFNRLNDDYLIFRIKNKDHDSWYYENTYKADQFQPNQYFTFGFPPIPDSKNKRYVFEIESTQGRPGVAVGVSQIEPLFIAKYKYDKTKVLSSWQSAGEFFINKTANLIKKAKFTAASLIYLILLVTYLLVLLPVYEKHKRRGKEIIKNLSFGIMGFLASHGRTLSIMTALLGIILDSVLVLNGDLTLLTLVAAWIVLAKSYKLPASFFFKVTTTLLFTSSITYIFNFQPVSQRFGAWVWIFMVFTLITSQIEKPQPVHEHKRPNLG